MAEPAKYTPFSIIVRLFFGILTIAVFGGLFLDIIAAQNPVWDARAKQIGFEATERYLRILAAFEGFK